VIAQAVSRLPWQFADVPKAIRRLLLRGPAPPPVYQGQYDPAALFAAMRTLVRQVSPAPFCRQRAERPIPGRPGNSVLMAPSIANHLRSFRAQLSTRACTVH
jgi:hypothetical protein